MTQNNSDATQNISVNTNTEEECQVTAEVTYPLGMEIGVITQRPSGRGGPATFRKITINADGTWQAIGEEIVVIAPILN